MLHHFIFYTIISYITLYNIIIHCNILRYYRGPASEWYEILSNHFRTSKKIRSWFAKNILFSHPQRFSEYLLESTSSEVGPMNSPLYYILLYSIVHCVWQTILSCSLEIWFVFNADENKFGLNSFFYGKICPITPADNSHTVLWW